MGKGKDKKGFRIRRTKAQIEADKAAEAVKTAQASEAAKVFFTATKPGGPPNATKPGGPPKRPWRPDSAAGGKGAAAANGVAAPDPHVVDLASRQCGLGAVDTSRWQALISGESPESAINVDPSAILKLDILYRDEPAGGGYRWRHGVVERIAIDNSGVSNVVVRFDNDKGGFDDEAAELEPRA